LLLATLLIISVLFIIISTTKFNLHAFLALLFAAIFFGLLSGMPLQEIIKSLEEGFGGTIGKIGIVIIAGTIIGIFLEKSGGAYAMAEQILKYIGEKSVPMAMSIIGYIVSIPVFADSGFVILSPLNKALTKRVGISLATTAIALSLGLMVTHTLMPPTPGPIAAAGILEADLGLVIMIALPISILTLSFGWLWATKFASHTYIDPEPDLTETELRIRLVNSPSALHSFLPILIPILLIVLKSISDYPTSPFGTEGLYTTISFIGAPVIALLIGVLLAITLPRKFDKKMLSSTGWIGEGLLAAAIIIMITGAGGAFGKVLQNSGIADVIGKGMHGTKLGLWMPFIIAAAIRAAQGSSTVAIITTASVLAPLLGALGLDSATGKALTVLAIGSGSIVASHANDSFFWIVTQMSGMNVKTGYKLMTVGTILMGIFACLIIWMASLFLL
jgi:GntP family gluconate:H+ symporter